MCENDYDFIEHQIGYDFENRKLLRQAFVRRSYSQEHGGENNEVLEFYGDKVLELVVGKLFAEHFCSGIDENEKQKNVYYMISNNNEKPKLKGEYSTKYDEGQLTEFRKALVSRNTLAQRIYDLDLEKFLLLGKSDENNDVRNKDSVREDLFEAILGAVAIDSNWDIKKMQSTVEVMLSTGQFFSDENNVDDITEWTINTYGCVPEFYYGGSRYSNVYWNDLLQDAQSLRYPFSHNHCYMKLGNYKYKFFAEGNTRGEARDNVCRFAYNHLRELDLLNPIKSELDHPTMETAIGGLETLSRRGYFDLPKYQYKETHDGNGNPKWTVTCSIKGFPSFTAKDSSKKSAKKKAAWKMLQHILDNYDKEA